MWSQLAVIRCLVLTDNVKPLDMKPEGTGLVVIVVEPLVAFFASVGIGQ